MDLKQIQYLGYGSISSLTLQLWMDGSKSLFASPIDDGSESLGLRDMYLSLGLTVMDLNSATIIACRTIVDDLVKKKKKL
jgi:hypothetical protein